MKIEIHHVYSRADCEQKATLPLLDPVEVKDAAITIALGQHPEFVYRIVAEIELPLQVRTAPFSYAYAMSQSVDNYWGMKSGATMYAPRCRSTSIGDMLMLNGKRFVVMPIGFEELDFKWVEE